MSIQSILYNVLSVIFWIPLRMFQVEACGHPTRPPASEPDLPKYGAAIAIRCVTSRVFGAGLLLGIPIGIAVPVAMSLINQKQSIVEGKATSIHTGREGEINKVKEQILRHSREHGLEDLAAVLKLDREEAITYKSILTFGKRALTTLHQDSFFRQFVCLTHIAVFLILFLAFSSFPGALELKNSTSSQTVSPPSRNLDFLCGGLKYTWEESHVGNFPEMLIMMTMGTLWGVGGNPLLARGYPYRVQVRESARRECFKLGVEWGNMVGEVMARNEIRDILLRYNIRHTKERVGVLTPVVEVDCLIADIQRLQSFEDVLKGV